MGVKVCFECRIELFLEVFLGFFQGVGDRLLCSVVNFFYGGVFEGFKGFELFDEVFVLFYVLFKGFEFLVKLGCEVHLLFDFVVEFSDFFLEVGFFHG